MVHYYIPSKKAIVFGYSMGGYIAMAFGAKYPELCRYSASLRVCVCVCVCVSTLS
jgi:pimeloyl-ACP methyl ester carboxylesterase